GLSPGRLEPAAAARRGLVREGHHSRRAQAGARQVCRRFSGHARLSSATSVYDVAQSHSDRPLVALYVGDWDPSGLYMSESDLPDRLRQYGGDHVDLRRVALTGEQALPLQSFPATGKRNDPRYPWFTGRYGDQIC